VGSLLVELDIPCCSIGSTLCAVHLCLPHLHTLVLRLGKSTAIDAEEDDDEDEGEGREGEGAFSSSQLHSLTLRMPPGAPPFHLYDFGDLPLRLHRHPRLQHLVLQGPIVQYGGVNEPPFLLRADARVGLAPWDGQVQLAYDSTRAGC